ncbi:hypothetical protein KC19_VG060500 [Ceratodon purpureus]|uniref:Uncharacterized protein n=1 Tax=Ceratodon purpureus TaxID=3225 RepID=A0A8T0HME5_CERPU|nr:hypothetical protein KC19_VG060500 [Ceratodon purpureus]
MPRLLPVFRELSEPLLPLREVIPATNIKEVAYKRPPDGTSSPVFNKESSPAPMMPPIGRNRSSTSTDLGVEVKTGFLYPCGSGSTTRKEHGVTSSRSWCHECSSIVEG